MDKTLFAALLVASLWAPAAGAQNPAAPSGSPSLEVSLKDGGARIAMRVLVADLEPRPPQWCVILVTSDRPPIAVAAGPVVPGGFATEMGLPPAALDTGFDLRAVVVDGTGEYALSPPVTVGNPDPPVQTEEDPEFCHQPGGVLDRIQVELIPTDSIPPQYSVRATFESDSDGYALWRGDVVRRDETTDVYLVLKTPDPDAGEGFRDIAQVLETGAHLGAWPGRTVRVWAAETKQRTGDRPLQYRVIATFPVDPGVPPNEPAAEGSWLDRIQLEMTATDSIPPEYTLLASFEAISDDFDLHAHSVTRHGDTTDVFLVLKIPGPGEGRRDVVEWHFAGVPLGTDPGRTVRVFAVEVTAYGPADVVHEFERIGVFSITS